jgi:hypothetical protein
MTSGLELVSLAALRKWRDDYRGRRNVESL